MNVVAIITIIYTSYTAILYTDFLCNPDVTVRPKNDIHAILEDDAVVVQVLDQRGWNRHKHSIFKLRVERHGNNLPFHNRCS